VFGTSLRLPQWLADLSPFAHQKPPAVDISVVAIIALLVVALAVGAAGLAVFRRCDLVPG
jgi:ABC-2 type transport system permease protein